MKFPNRRGAHWVKTRIKNQIAIADYFRENPLATQKQCAESLGLTNVTVSNHVRYMREHGVPTTQDAALEKG